MRSPATAIEAGDWTRNAPNSRPRSGPVPTGVTTASRSWIRSVTSATCVTPFVYLPSVHPCPCDDPAPCAEDEGGRKILGFHVCEHRMRQVYLGEVRRVAGFQA